MSDYCQECSEKLFGRDFGDLAGLCHAGEFAVCLCEGCGGYIIVDHKGKRRPETPVEPPISNASE